MSSLPVPYKLPVSLSIGSCVIITGRPKLSFLNDPQLEVNFYTGTNEDSDIAFQFRVNFGDCVIMNTREIGMWRCEEKCYNVPFEDGKSFELRICAHYDEYKVMVNGQHIYNFLHRIPPLFVNMVEVWGDISLTRVLVYN
ncbi:placental protein 13-like isoform X4 [Callithrix jacchus]|uniref:Galectin-14 n=1 Tax=Callithrix jacchus TaxID=9483 RepID=C4XVB0_CALJA|nr:placental protein 13-like isoform X2 [Callithrix jacchus]DAA06522.1 TPA_inf: galectin-14 precursor [Callithrix jacchus]